MYTYCLYCEAGKSSYVAVALMAKLGCQTIIPKHVQHTWDKGKMINRIHNLLPGYLFLYSDEPLEVSSCQRTQGVVRCLRDGEGQYELQGKDEEFALFLLDRKGIIGKTQVTENNGILEIGPKSFRGADVKITKVDRRNTRMQIEIRFLRQIIRTWIEYEIIEPTETEQEGIEENNGADS